MTLGQAYRERCERRSDIYAHLPVLCRYAQQVKRVTEFGTRLGNSTVAFLSGKPERLTCYDLSFRYVSIAQFQDWAEEAGTHLEFIVADTATVSIQETDLLFIDSIHTYHQVKAELRNAEQVTRYLVFHDTVKYGVVGENGEAGINAAILELRETGLWRQIAHYVANNGLTILERFKC